MSFGLAVATLLLAFLVPAPERLRHSPRLVPVLLGGSMALLAASLAVGLAGSVHGAMAVGGVSVSLWYLLLWCGGFPPPPEDDDGGGGGGGPPDDPPPPDWGDFDRLRSGWERDRLPA